MKRFARILLIVFCGMMSVKSVYAEWITCTAYCSNALKDGEYSDIIECYDYIDSVCPNGASDCEYNESTAEIDCNGGQAVDPTPPPPAQPVTCRVLFSPNGAGGQNSAISQNGGIASVSVESGSSITLPNPDGKFFNGGYGFYAWSFTSEGDGNREVGEPVNITCDKSTGYDVYIYATWEKCGRGYYSDGNNTYCLACSAGQYQDEIGKSQCKTCMGRNQYSSGGASACSTVRSGYYSTGCNTSGNNCTGETICEKGYFCQEGVRSECPAGSYADVTGTSNANCTQCAAGTASNDTARKTACPACAKGTYTTIPGQISCLSCNANRYTNKETGATQCTSCPSYTYAPANSVGESSCKYETCESYLNSNKSSIINLGYDWDEMSEKWADSCGSLSDGCFVVEPYGDSWDILQHRCCDGSIEQCKLPDRFTECTETCTDIDRSTCPSGVLCDNTTMNTEYKCSGVQYEGDSFCSVAGGVCLCPYQASSVSCASKLGSPWQGSYSTEYRDGEEEAQRKFCYKECSVNCTNDVNAPCPYGKHCDCPDKATCDTPIGGITWGKEYYPGGTCIPNTEVPRCYIPNFSCPEGYTANLDTWACELKIYSAKLDDQSATTAASPRQIYYYYDTEKYYTGQSGTTLTGQISSITPPTRTGFTFGGYWTAVNGGGTQYIAGSTISGLYKLVPTTGTESTLYAFWTGKPITVTLNLDLEDTTGMNAGNTKFFYYYDTVTDSGVRYYRERDGNTLSNAIEHAQNGSKIVYPRDRKGYKFMGYYTERNGEGTQYVSEFGRILDDMYKTVSADTTLYAKWEVAEYTVTYSCGCTAEFGDKCTGTPPEQVKIKYGADFTAAPIPTGDSACKNQGRDFAGWAVSGTEDVLSAEQKVVWKYGENKTLSVSWAKCQAGYYCPPDATEKKQCPMGTTSEAGATKIEQCFMKGGETQICDKNGCYTLPTTVPKVYFSGTATMN